MADEYTPEQLLDMVQEGPDGLSGLIAYARQQGHYCCQAGCGSGACESCPCCSAGWCVSGVDGLPDDPADRAWWLEVAAEHNPVARALAEGGES